jgi:hypothetical protein
MSASLLCSTSISAYLLFDFVVRNPEVLHIGTSTRGLGLNVILYIIVHKYIHVYPIEDANAQTIIFSIRDMLQGKEFLK